MATTFAQLMREINEEAHSDEKKEEDPLAIGFKVLKGEDANGVIDGTHLQDYAETKYDDLVKTFGEPEDISSPGNKSDVEWTIQFADGLIGTIYNYKDGPNYGGGAVEEITNWHIGGKDYWVVARIIGRLPAPAPPPILTVSA